MTVEQIIMPSETVVSQDITISCYENEVPPFIESEIEMLYGSIFSSILQFRTYGGVFEKTSTYIARKGQEPIAILLFRQERGRLHVLNEVFRLDQEELNRFATYAFDTYKSVNVISFKAIQTDVQRFATPHQRFNYTEDLVLSLPPATQQYLTSLGKNTRRNVKRYTDRLKRCFPSFRFDAHQGPAVDEKLIRDVIRFNRSRMADKNKISVIDELEVQRIIRRVKACGLVGVVTIDGRVCAGAISYRTGGNYFLDVLSHDPRYDDYWIGMLCCYLTICECIIRGGKEFHFLWGRYEYKLTLGAVRRDLDIIVLYRSRTQLLLNADFAFKTAYNGYLRRGRLWQLYTAPQRDSVMARLAIRLLKGMRILKRFTAH